MRGRCLNGRAGDNEVRTLSGGHGTRIEPNGLVRFTRPSGGYLTALLAAAGPEREITPGPVPFLLSTPFSP